MSRVTRARRRGSVTARMKAGSLMFGGVALCVTCASSPPPESAHADSLGDKVVLKGDDPAADDAELGGEDYLVQVKSGEYRVGRTTGRGKLSGIVPFTLANGDALKSATYYLTQKAGGMDVQVGVTACFFRDAEKDGVYGKPPSSDAARSGAWQCRIVRDTNDRSRGLVLVGNDKVSTDNLRIPRREGGGIE